MWKDLKQDHGIALFQNSVIQHIVSVDEVDIRLKKQCEVAEIDLSAKTWRVVLMDIRHLDVEQITDAINHFKRLEKGMYYSFLDREFILGFLFYGSEACKREQIEIFFRQKNNEYIGKQCVGRLLSAYHQLSESYHACKDFINAGVLFNGDFICLEDYGYEEFIHLKSMKRLRQMFVNMCMENVNESQIKNIKKELQRLNFISEKENLLICCIVLWISRYIQSEKSQLIEAISQKVDQLSSVEEIEEWLNSFIKKRYIMLSKMKKDMNPHVKYAIQEIERCYEDSNFCLQRVAESRGITAGYLGGLFKGDMGIYFKDYLLSFRLKKAAQLIITTDMTIREIVPLSGFVSQSNFNKVFQRFYGVSPSGYRISNIIEDVF